MTLSPSDLVQIPFPFSDLSHQKRRPVLLLTAPDAFGDFLAAAVTSQPGHNDAIPLHDDDIAQGPLPKASWVRATRLFSLNRDSVVLKLGNLKPEAFERIHGGICARLGCAEDVVLNDIADNRLADGKSPLKVKLDEL